MFLKDEKQLIELSLLSKDILRSLLYFNVFQYKIIEKLEKAVCNLSLDKKFLYIFASNILDLLF